jgi:regulator of cell morphogenesis and NO signaling
MISPQTTLRTIALDQPATIRVFERFHLDYCCGGKRPLAEACSAQGIDAAQLIVELEEAIAGGRPTEIHPQSMSNTELIRHIVDTHHSFVRAELPRLDRMMKKVVAAHGSARPEIAAVAGHLARLAEELTTHLMKEEQILFPYIEALDHSRAGIAEPPHACFATVESPIQMMLAEHEEAAALLEQMRSATNGFTPWQGACPTSAGLYHGLAEFERDLHRHVHLENNLLFPRAIEAEREAMAISRG